MISNINKNDLISSSDYIKCKERYNQLKFILDDIIKDDKELLKLKECYTDDINNKLKLCYIKTKPCEFSYIENEKALLSPYLNKLSEDDINNMLLKSIDNTKILECEKTLSLLKEKLINIENIEKELVIIKPPNANNPLINKDDLIKKILQVFINIENFKHHNYNIKAINDTNHNKTY